MVGDAFAGDFSREILLYVVFSTSIEEDVEEHISLKVALHHEGECIVKDLSLLELFEFGMEKVDETDYYLQA